MKPDPVFFEILISPHKPKSVLHDCYHEGLKGNARYHGTLSAHIKAYK